MMTHEMVFLTCTGPECGLRFPLDLNTHRGSYCPRCGGSLQIEEAALPSLAAPAGQARAQISGLLDNLRSAQNVGAIFRSADGAGFKQLYLCGITATPGTNPKIGKTALGAEKELPWSYHANALPAAEALKAAGYTLLALEVVPGSKPLYSFSPQAEAKIVLIVGNEEAGVDPALLRLADDTLHLPMQGKKNSLNVAEAFSIAAYHLCFG